MDTFAERLKALIETKKIKQTELADLIGVNSKSINTYVGGRSEPNLNLLKKMAEKLEVPIEYFFGYISLNDALKSSENSNKREIFKLINNIEADISPEAVRLIKMILLAFNHNIADKIDMLLKLDSEGLAEIANQINKEYSIQEFNNKS
jgi:transcriptional regulator with XRE-family HTH domain